MNFNNDDLDFEELGMAPSEQLALENDLLKLKMQAELGARFGAFADSPELSPELERMFLENILAFEKMYEEMTPVPVREYLGFPEFPPVAGLTEAELACEWARLQAIYGENELRVSFLAEYPLSLMYEFMAVEFLDVETEPAPGWCYVYEDYHPNHDHELREQTAFFLRSFFQGRFCEFSLMKGVTSPDGALISFSGLQLLLDRFHEQFERVDSWKFSVCDVDVQYQAALSEGGHQEPHLGCTQGNVSYSMVLPEGGRGVHAGQFRIFWEAAYGFWYVRSFELFGFAW